MMHTFMHKHMHIAHIMNGNEIRRQQILEPMTARKRKKERDEKSRYLL